MWAWQVCENGEWNIIAVMMDGMFTPLVTTRERTYEATRVHALAHALASGLPVRGVRYDEPEWMETIA